MSSPTPRTRFVVLGLLCTEPMSGYDLKRSIDETLGAFWQESYGQLYPTLKQLHEAGLVTEAAAPLGARRRKVYSITGAGRAALAAWLGEPPLPETTRSEIALKVFFGAFAPPGSVEGHLHATIRRTGGQLAGYAALRARLAALDPPPAERLWWNLTLDLGERVARARAEWAEAALCNLPPGSPP